MNTTIISDTQTDVELKLMERHNERLAAFQRILQKTQEQVGTSLRGVGSLRSSSPFQHALSGVNSRVEITKEEIVKEEVKKEQGGVDVVSDFTKLSLELTYLFRTRHLLPDTDFSVDFADTLYHEAVSWIESSQGYCLLKKIIPSEWDHSDDDGCLEVQTGIQSDLKKVLRLKNKMEKGLEKYNFVPSSVEDMNCGGNCHMNFDLGTYSQSTKLLFVTNLKAFLLTYPSLIWLFLSPNDNNSSNITDSNVDNRCGGGYSKGEFFTIRTGAGATFDTCYPHKSIIGYIELRFFMMPRDNKELILHYDFTRTLLLYIQSVTLRGETLKYKFSCEDLESYTYEKSLSEIRSGFKKIGFDFKRIERTDKLELLKLRFEYGKDWLV